MKHRCPHGYDHAEPPIAEQLQRVEARHARADDEDAKLGIGRHLRLVPVRRPPILVAVGQLLLEERQVGAHVVGADGELHHAQHVVVAGGGRRAAASVAVPDQRRESQRPRRRR